MRRAAVVVGVTVTLVLPSTPAAAELVAGPAESPEREAVGLLVSAAVAARATSYTGTQRVTSWTGAGASSDLVPVRHDALAQQSADADLDPRRISLLAASYDLTVPREGRCAGRSADVVEAHRADGSLAASFWVDRDSGLLLRREVRDDHGRRARTSTFVDVEIGSATGASMTGTTEALPGPEDVRELQDDGWQVPADLPGGFRLLQTDLATVEDGEHVLHLAYSDGLVNVSLFAQEGELGAGGVDGFEPDVVGARPVWMRHADHEQAVWSGAGHVWTLVSDAPPQRVRAALAGLPRDPAPSDGLGSRLRRGMGRVASMLNPVS